MNLPSDWTVAKLEDCCTTITDGSHFSPKEFPDGHHKIATVANIEKRQINLETCKRISKNDYDNLIKNGCKPECGDVLLTKDGTVGVSFVYKQRDEVVLLSSIAIIRPKETLFPDYCAHALQSKHVLNKILGSRRGTGLKRIILADINRIEIPLPPLLEQQKIAEILSTVDDTIQKSDEIIAKTERLKRGMMRKLLMQGIGHTKFKDSELGKLPKEWEVTKVSDIFEVITGTTPSTKVVDYWKNATINWFTPADMTDITGKAYLSESNRKITKKGVEDTTLTLMPAGSLVLSTRAPVGYVGILRSESTFNQGCKGLIPKKDKKIAPEFYYYYFSLIQKKLQNMSSGSTFMELSKAALGRCLIVYFGYAEQQKIAEILSSFDQKLELEQKRKAKLERVKKALMNDLLTGRKRVS